MTKPNLVLVRERAPDFDLPTLHEVGGEPRIRDVDLAERLGMADLHKIRALIRKNEAELKDYGSIATTMAANHDRGARSVKTFWLNEGQALIVCALSRSLRAAQVRRSLIECFLAYRRRRLQFEGGVMRLLARQIETEIAALDELSDRIGATRASLDATFAAYAAGMTVRP